MGSIIGVLVIPTLGDLKGKYSSTNLSLISILLGNCLVFFGVFTSAYILIGLGQFLCAFGSVAMAALSYSINSDFFSDDLR